jgi:hypothetical protein
MKRLPYNRSLTAALVTMFMLAACGGGDQTATTGQLRLALTDGPVEKATKLVVAFTGIELKPAGGPALDPVIMDEAVCDSFDAATGTCSIDLLTLAGMNRRVVFSGNLQAGNYEWLRLLVLAELNVMDSYIEFEDGSMCSLWIPSGAETGLKIVSGITVTANGVSDYTLDIDARKSVTGPPGLATASPGIQCQENYVLKPAIRIVDTTEVGSIAGTVEEALLESDDSCTVDEFGLYENIAVYVFENFDDMAVGDDIDEDATNPDPVTTASVVWNDDPAIQAYEYEAGFLLAPENYLAALTCTSDMDDIMVNDYDPASADAQDFSFVAEQTVTVEVGLTADGSFAAPASP